MKKSICVILFLSIISLVTYSQSVAKFYTTKGNITIVLEDTLAPITAGNFIGLINSKYYDGVLFHRVINNFMIQGGDATLTGGSKSPVIRDEFVASLSNVKGTISMANAGPNTGSSQFFINIGNNTYLDFNKPPLSSKHPVFGHVLTGFSVVETISKVPKNGANRPLTNVVIDSIRITEPWFALSVSANRTETIGLRVYPNPAQNKLTVSLNSNELISIEIIDITGKLVFQNEIQNKEEINISELNEGVYILKINHFGKYVFERIVISR